MAAKRWFFGLVGGLLLFALPFVAQTAYAHAVLVRSEPAANAQLNETPHEIRLWFTEPLEAAYSSIELRDASGTVINTPPSYVDPTDPHQLVLMAGELPDGLYTVVWRNVSSADGHRVAGSFPFVIGTAPASVPAASSALNELTRFNIFARWFNFGGLALAVGSIAFVVFVWQPAMREVARAVPRAMWGMVWVGWLAAGIGAVLLLLNQTAILLNEPVGDVLTWSKVAEVVETTRFGTLWLWRMGLWLVMGALLLAAARSTLAAWLATACGLAMLLPVSLYSHAAVSNDVVLSVFSDWVHLAMMTLWVGGLVQFLVAIPVVYRLIQPAAPKVGLLVAHFSNCARISVAGLILTGIYATWLQVTTVEALTTTLYGQLLTVKLLLGVVLLAVAAINFVWTQRHLLAGREVWISRLHGLITLEILLTFAILLAVGMMTAISPARNEIAQREAAAAVPPAPEPQPIHLVEDADDLQIHFTAMPGWVGNSTFTVQLVNEDGEPITNAKLIRMRFEHQTENLGESELQIRPEGEAADGVYSIEGANLSAVGNWRLRMTIQRPDAFDTIADFEFSVIEPPPPPPAPVVESNPILPYRRPVLLLLGFPAIALGVLFLMRERLRFWQGAGLLASLLLMSGAAFLLTGFLL